MQVFQDDLMEMDWHAMNTTSLKTYSSGNSPEDAGKKINLKFSNIECKTDM